MRARAVHRSLNSSSGGGLRSNCSSCGRGQQPSAMTLSASESSPRSVLAARALSLESYVDDGKLADDGIIRPVDTMMGGTPIGIKADLIVST